MTKDLHDSDGTLVAVNFSPRLAASFPNSIFEHKYVMSLVNDASFETLVLSPDIEWQNNILNELQTMYVSYKEAAFGYEFDLCSSLMNLWKMLVINIMGEADGKNGNTDNKEPSKNRGRRNNSHELNQRLRDIITYIQEHYTEKITLEDISLYVHLSSNECCRFFKKNMRCTLFEYLIDFRLGKSMELLENTSLTVGQIAYETGFGSSSYYIEKFRSKTGVTPNVYRKSKVDC